jgi:hypothetical protein
MDFAISKPMHSIQFTRVQRLNSNKWTVQLAKVPFKPWAAYTVVISNGTVRQTAPALRRQAPSFHIAILAVCPTRQLHPPSIITQLNRLFSLQSSRCNCVAESKGESSLHPLIRFVLLVSHPKVRPPDSALLSISIRLRRTSTDAT